MNNLFFREIKKAYLIKRILAFITAILIIYLIGFLLYTVFKNFSSFDNFKAYVVSLVALPLLSITAIWFAIGYLLPYALTSIHSVPVVGKYLSMMELHKKLSFERFFPLSFEELNTSDEDLNIYESENWYLVKGKYIPKSLVIFAFVSREYDVPLKYQRYLSDSFNFVYITGDIVQIKLGFLTSMKFQKYMDNKLWNEDKISNTPFPLDPLYDKGWLCENYHFKELMEEAKEGYSVSSCKKLMREALEDDRLLKSIYFGGLEKTLNSRGRVFMRGLGDGEEYYISEYVTKDEW